jgi:opine dehydrogenase
MVTVTLVGGGNSTLCLAPLVAAAGFKCNILTRRPNDWHDEVEVVNEDLGWLKVTSVKSRPDVVTSDAARVIPESDIVWFAGVPIHHNPSLLQAIKNYLPKTRHVFIGTICCYGGFEWVVQRELGPGNYTVFGTQLIPWCCGTREYGSTGVIFGAKRFLRIVTSHGLDRLDVKKMLKPILRQPLMDTNFLASTLWPNNSSLHPPIMYGLFKDWDGQSGFDRSSLPVKIYAEMTDESAKYVCEMDAELCAIVDALRRVFPGKDAFLTSDFSMRACVLENYEDQVADPSSTASTIRTNAAFGQHKIPYTELPDGKIVPTLQHKFFETDLPYGLVTFHDIASMVGVSTPLIDDIIRWNQRLIGKEYMAADGSLTGKDIHEAIVPSLWGMGMYDLLG